MNGQVWSNHSSDRFKGRIDGRTVTISDDGIPSMDAYAGRYVQAGTGLEGMVRLALGLAA